MFLIRFGLICLGCATGLFFAGDALAQVTIINNNNNHYYVAPPVSGGYGVVYDVPYRNNYHGYWRDLGYGFTPRRSFYRGYGRGLGGQFYNYDRYRALQYYPPRRQWYSRYR